jgi:biopolymer transport protein TolR
MAGGIIQQSSRGGGRRRSHRPLSEINVTPLVDVMLVLLIVFMVTAPLLNNGVHVDLPKSKAAPLEQSDDKPLQISIDAKGQIFLQDTPVDLAQLVPKLNAISQENHDAKIYIRGDRANSWGTMMEVLGAVGGAGYGKVGLVSNPADGTPAKHK